MFLSHYFSGKQVKITFLIWDGQLTIKQLYGQLMNNLWHYGISPINNQNTSMVVIWKESIKWLFIPILLTYLPLLMKTMPFMFSSLIKITNDGIFWIYFLFLLCFLFIFLIWKSFKDEFYKFFFINIESKSFPKIRI